MTQWLGADAWAVLFSMQCRWSSSWAPCLPSLVTAPSFVCPNHRDRNSTPKKPCYAWVQLVRKFCVFHRHLVFQEQKWKWNSVECCHETCSEITSQSLRETSLGLCSSCCLEQALLVGFQAALKAWHTMSRSLVCSHGASWKIQKKLHQMEYSFPFAKIHKYSKHKLIMESNM